MKDKQQLTWKEFMHEEAIDKKKRDLTPVSSSRITMFKLTFTRKVTAQDIVEIEDVKSEKKGCDIL